MDVRLNKDQPSFSLCNKDHNHHSKTDHRLNKDSKCPMFSFCNKDHNDHGHMDHKLSKDRKCQCLHCAIRIITVIDRSLTRKEP